jgi:hypothetical protein
MTPKFACDPLHLAFGVREHCLIVRRFADFVGRPGLREQLLQLGEIVGADRPPLTPQHHESHRSIQLWYLCFRERARDLLRQPKPSYTTPLAVALFHVIVDVDVVAAHRDAVGQPLQPFSRFSRDEFLLVHREARRLEVIH